MGSSCGRWCNTGGSIAVPFFFDGGRDCGRVLDLDRATAGADLGKGGGGDLFLGCFIFSDLEWRSSTAGRSVDERDEDSRLPPLDFSPSFDGSVSGTCPSVFARLTDEEEEEELADWGDVGESIDEAGLRWSGDRGETGGGGLA